MNGLDAISKLIAAHQGREGTGDATVEDLQAWCDAAGTAVHVAVMVEPYLTKIERGEKYIESRLTKMNISPFERARPGDVILFKRSGGAIVAMAEVDNVRFEILNAPHNLAELVEEYSDGLSYEPEYVASKAEARYASLLWISGVQGVQSLPIEKRGRQAWWTFHPTGVDSSTDPTLF
jgi:hypothetical protein